ncbi:MAG: glucosyl-3-phosphoglycerate synthase [bacterium]|nr:glucosyl-3-phosphoglycerate synthase [bacterium]
MAARPTVDRLAERKGSRTIAVCLPALNEESTVGAICAEVRRRLMAPAAGLVDDLVVLDDDSADRTREVAASSGARVVRAADVLPEAGEGFGKGNALWKSVAATTADLIVWCDADLASFEAHYVTALVEPLLADEEIVLVKGYYERMLHGRPGGGRTTELMARPLLAQFFPELAHLRQPLGGEYAVRRRAVEQVPFVQGWGVEVGLLIDLARRFGADRITEADLGVRRHRNRPLEELGPQALAILQTVLQRSGVRPPAAGGGWSATLQIPGVALREVSLRERPPLNEVRGAPVL